MRRVRAAFAQRGLRLGALSAGRLSIPLRARAATIERGLDVQLRTLQQRGRETIAATRAPALAAGAAGDVQSIVGLDSSASPRPLITRPRRLGPLRKPPTVDAAATDATAPASVAGRSGPKPCSAASVAGGNLGGYTDQQLASAYGFDGLYRADDTGVGTTIAVYELEPDDPADITAYAACYGIHPNISYVRVDGGAGHGAGSDEAAFDIENVIGFAPGAKVLVYQGPSSSSTAPGSGPYDTFAKIVNQDRAQVVSASWGRCEAQLGRANARAENTLFTQASVQGQSIVAAAGDNGAQDCHIPGAPGYHRLTVDDPASQPYVTGVGGTTLQGLGPPLYQTVWNSKHESAGSPSDIGASGGGVSSIWPMPPAQAQARKSLGVKRSAATGHHCGRARGYCREVPDVSIDADPSTGYVMYFNGAHKVAKETSGWQVLGGTSGGAPVWAALLALADSSKACRHRPIGYADPALYRAASTAYAKDFEDITQGGNAFAVRDQGFLAQRGYDPVSGLGTPNATPLVASLCSSTLRLARVSARHTPVHTQVSLRLHATDQRGRRLRWSATGLPPGLALDPGDGRIGGRPSRAGHYTVRVIVRDRQRAAATSTFRWTIT